MSAVAVQINAASRRSFSVVTFYISQPAARSQVPFSSTNRQPSEGSGASIRCALTLLLLGGIPAPANRAVALTLEIVSHSITDYLGKSGVVAILQIVLHCVANQHGRAAVVLHL